MVNAGQVVLLDAQRGPRIPSAGVEMVCATDPPRASDEPPGLRGVVGGLVQAAIIVYNSRTGRSGRVITEQPRGRHNLQCRPCSIARATRLGKEGGVGGGLTGPRERVQLGGGADEGADGGEILNAVLSCERRKCKNLGKNDQSLRC